MKAGDKVTWESQSLGSWKEKSGVIVAMIPKGESANGYIPPYAKKSHVKFDVDRSANDRVLVAVPAGKDGQITHYYCPAKAVLENQGN